MNIPERMAQIEEWARIDADKRIIASGPRYFHTEPFEGPEERLAASKLSPRARQWTIKRLTVKYPVFNTGYEIIRENHFPVANGIGNSGKVGAMLGESRTGKTVICDYYAAQHPPIIDDEGESFPVVKLTASLKMTPMEFGERINKLTAARYERRSGGVGLYVDNAIQRFLKVRTELLIIDEAQFLFFERPESSVSSMYKIVKEIVDLDALVVMLVGDERIDDFVYAISAFENRGYNTQPLKALTAGQSDMHRFRKLLGSIDRRLPFARLSGFDDPSSPIAEELYRYSRGLIGRVMKLIEPAAYLAINDGSAMILVEHLRRAVSTRAGKDDYDYFGYKRHAA
jgi:hypothetical protein